MDTKFSESIIFNKNNITKFLERMKEYNYCDQTLVLQEKNLNNFKQFVEANNIEKIDLGVFSLFIKYRFNVSIKESKKSSVATARATLFKFYEFCKNGTISKITYHNSTYKVPDCYLQEYNQYFELINDKYDRTTINNKKVFLKLFFIYMNEINIYNLHNINQDDIVNFMNHCYASGYSKAYVYKIGYFIRDYLNYLHEIKVIDFSGKQVIPKQNVNYGCALPTTYDIEELKLMLKSVDKNTKIGKRDYLILLLLINYGIRIGDITNLKIDDFNINLNVIKFIQKKNNKLQILPLYDEVKFAFIDYLKNSRNKSDLTYLFITTRAPYNNYDKRSLREIVSKYLEKANIDTENKKRGSHSIRHSLASNLLNSGSNIKEISDILGHSSLNTTTLYLTIFQKQLKELSLEAPLYEKL